MVIIMCLNFVCSAKQLVRGEPNVSYICSRYYRAPELIFGATDYTSSIGRLAAPVTVNIQTSSHLISSTWAPSVIFIKCYSWFIWLWKISECWQGQTLCPDCVWLLLSFGDLPFPPDVWSAGCVLAELLLGQPIFPGDSGVDQLVEIIKVMATLCKSLYLTLRGMFFFHKWIEIYG